MGYKVTEMNRIIKSFVSGNLSFIDNSKIGSRMLNSSGLHLNRKGSVALAKNILNHVSNCYWFKEVNSFSPEFEPNCYDDMTSALKVRGFKFASINVASLSLHIEELWLIMADQCLDLLAVNESRLDSTITDNLVHIDNPQKRNGTVMAAAYAFIFDRILIIVLEMK